MGKQTTRLGKRKGIPYTIASDEDQIIPYLGGKKIAFSKTATFHEETEDFDVKEESVNIECPPGHRRSLL